MKISWRRVESFPRRNSAGTLVGNSEGLAVVFNNKIYVFGGYVSNNPRRDAYVFDPAADSNGAWTRIADMPKGNTHAGIATDGRYIYIVSGYIEDLASGNQTFGTVEVYRYDPLADTYSRMRDLPVKQAAGVAAVIGNELHYVGGTNSVRTAELGEHWVLDLSTPGATWQSRAPLPNPRHHMGGVTYQGKLYIVGGQHRHDGSLKPQDDVHVYDPATNTWAQLADLPEGRNHISSTTFVLNDELYVLGGQYLQTGKTYTNPDGTTFVEEPRDTVFVYNFATNTWRSAQDPLPAKRHSAVGGTVGGKLYFSTGGTATSYEGVFTPVP